MFCMLSISSTHLATYCTSASIDSEAGLAIIMLDSHHPTNFTKVSKSPLACVNPVTYSTTIVADVSGSWLSTIAPAEFAANAQDSSNTTVTIVTKTTLVSSPGSCHWCRLDGQMTTLPPSCWRCHHRWLLSLLKRLCCLSISLRAACIFNRKDTIAFPGMRLTSPST